MSSTIGAISNSTTQPLNPARGACFELGGLLYVSAGGAAFGAIAGALVAPLGATGGAIFGASSVFSGVLILLSCQKLNCRFNNTVAATAACAFVILSGIAVGAATTAAFGFPITIMTGCTLAIASVAVWVAMGVIAIIQLFVGLFLVPALCPYGGHRQADVNLFSSSQRV